jgi:hypothetical protein
MIWSLLLILPVGYILAGYYFRAKNRPMNRQQRRAHERKKAKAKH